jgi:YesN/AraC family two-component response regulator
LESTQQKPFEHKDILQLLQEIESAIEKMQEEQAKNEEYQKLEDLEQRITGFEVSISITSPNV